MIYSTLKEHSKRRGGQLGEMVSYHHLLLLLLSAAANLAVSEISAAKTAIDERCFLTGIPAQEPADTTVYFNLRSVMKCVARIGFTGSEELATYSYSRNKKSTYVVSNAVVTLRKEMLDGGVNTGITVASTYVNLLVGQTSEDDRLYVVGNIVGKKLGGSDLVQNVFPMSTQTKIKDDYSAFEDKIYTCLKDGLASSAFLRWSFHYRTSSENAPYKIVYKAKFHDSSSADCKDMKMTFEN